MALTRRTVLAALGSSGAAVAMASTPAFAGIASPGVVVDRNSRTLRFTRTINRTTLRRALRDNAIPHRWQRPDSLDLHGWRITTPELARDFGWSTVESDGTVTEGWAELQIDTFDDHREFELSINGERTSTQEQRVHFRCDQFPRVRLLDLASGNAGGDHLRLLDQHGPTARCHRLAAVA